MRFKIPWTLGKGNLPGNFQKFFFIQVEFGKGKPNANIVGASHPFGRGISNCASPGRGVFSQGLQQFRAAGGVGARKTSGAFAAFSCYVRFNCADLPGHVVKRHIAETRGAEHRDANLALRPLTTSFFSPMLQRERRKK